MSRLTFVGTLLHRSRLQSLYPTCHNENTTSTLEALYRPIHTECPVYRPDTFLHTPCSLLDSRGSSEGELGRGRTTRQGDPEPFDSNLDRGLSDPSRGLKQINILTPGNLTLPGLSVDRNGESKFTLLSSGLNDSRNRFQYLGSS